MNFMYSHQAKLTQFTALCEFWTWQLKASSTPKRESRFHALALQVPDCHEEIVMARHVTQSRLIHFPVEARNNGRECKMELCLGKAISFPC